MIDAYKIGIRLALDNGVSAGLAVVRRDLAALDAAIAHSAAGLVALQKLAGGLVDAGPARRPAARPASRAAARARGPGRRTRAPARLARRAGSAHAGRATAPARGTGARATVTGCPSRRASDDAGAPSDRTPGRATGAAPVIRAGARHRAPVASGPTADHAIPAGRAFATPGGASARRGLATPSRAGAPDRAARPTAEPPRVQPHPHRCRKPRVRSERPHHCHPRH